MRTFHTLLVMGFSILLSACDPVEKPPMRQSEEATEETGAQSPQFSRQQKLERIQREEMTE